MGSAGTPSLGPHTSVHSGDTRHSAAPDVSQCLCGRDSCSRDDSGSAAGFAAPPEPVSVHQTAAAAMAAATWSCGRASVPEAVVRNAALHNQVEYLDARHLLDHSEAEALEHRLATVDAGWRTVVASTNDKLLEAQRRHSFEVDRLRREVSEAETALRTARDEWYRTRVELDTEVRDCKRALAEQQADAAHNAELAHRNLTQTRQSLRSVAAQLDAEHRQLVETQDQRSQCTAELSAVRGMLQQLKQQHMAVAAQCDELRAVVSTVPALRQQLDAVRTAYEAEVAHTADLQVKLSSSTSTCASLQSAVAGLTKERDAALEQVAQVHASEAALRVSNSELQQRVVEMVRVL